MRARSSAQRAFSQKWLIGMVMRTFERTSPPWHEDAPGGASTELLPVRAILAAMQSIERRIEMVFARLAAAMVVAAFALACAPGAFAISNGTLDGNRHPGVGMFASGDGRAAECTGFYIGRSAADPTEGVFLTAGHCVAWLALSEFPASDLWVTFESEVSIDPETFETTAASWHQASAYAFDPDFGAKRSSPHDWAVIVLEDAPDVPPLELPTAGLLDDLSERGGLRPDALFDNVGYGVIPTRTGPLDFEMASGRMLSTSRFQSLRPVWLYLLGNSAISDDIGGVCFGDSGAPKLIHETNTVVALQTGGDARCRAHANSQRLDTTIAREFLGQYVVLP
jgi:hypothetical protein